MDIQTFKSKQELGRAAAEDAAGIICQAISKRGRAYLIAATGASQFEFLDALARQPDPGVFNFVDGEAADPASECRRVGDLISSCTIDAAFVGIGENGHLAFNDPPADFETEEPYIVVQLDEACRRQQLGEGWFTSLEQVPQKAISMSIREILRSANILCIVPDKRKAQAVKNSLEGEIGPNHPASVLQQHPRTTIYLDTDSASLLSALPDV